MGRKRFALSKGIFRYDLSIPTPSAPVRDPSPLEAKAPRGGPWQAEVRRQQTYVRGLRLFLANARARLLEQSGGADRPGGRELAGLGDVQAECADHYQDSRRDNDEVDAIHRSQPRALGIVPGARSVRLPTFV